MNSNREAISAAARYLKSIGAPGNMPNALFRYNHSQRYVDAVTRYATRMQRDPMAYRGYWGWQVYYWMESGPELLPEGWKKPT